MTKSQFKFHDLYNSYEHWKTEFEKELYGYKRTFNIASYAEDLCDLKKETMVSYQPLQTLLFTRPEIQSVTLRGYEIYQRISKDIDEFIKYRGMIQTVNDETGEIEVDESLPPYYHALLYDKSLYNDKYIKEKVKEDIDNFRNNILSGKCIVDGNYQTLTVDVYAFMQYIFGMPVNGLLRKGQVYSNFWNTYHKSQKEIDIIRSPHIAMEHRIGYLRKSEKMLKWYKYQTTGIITSIHDTYLLALGGADADGDEVCSTSSYEVINAVKREIAAGHGRTIYFKKLDSHSDRSCYINDASALMRVNLDSFKNSIGNVINEITKLWAQELTEDVRDAIKICSCIGVLVIDFAKTGEPSEIPTDIKRMLKNVKKPHFMRYLKKNRVIARQEENAIKTAIDAKKSKEYIECLKAFDDTDSNMNRLCKHMEDIIQKRDITPYYEDESFNHECLMNQKKPVISREVRKKVLELHEMYSDIGTEYNMEKKVESDDLKKDYASRYRYLYDNARWELLNLCNSVGKLVDMLVAIYYTDRRLKDKSKDMLWNTFGNELAKRCKGESIEYSLEANLIKAKRYQSGKVLKERVLDKQQVKKAKVQTLEVDSVVDNKILFSLEDRKYIKGCVDGLVASGKMKELHKIDCMRFYAVLLLITRKLQSDSFVKYPNKPDDITDLTLSKIAGIDRRKIKAFLVLLEECDFIEVDIDKHNVVKIKVNYQPSVEGNQSDLWINEQNYSVACTKIRDYFRK